jgi:hypothetical protein
MAEQKLVLMASSLNPMLAMAQEAFKLLESYMAAGFTRKEAFDLTASQLPEWGFPGQTIIEEEDIEDEEDDIDDDDYEEEIEEGY